MYWQRISSGYGKVGFSPAFFVSGASFWFRPPRPFRWHDRHDLSHWGSEPLRLLEEHQMKHLRLSAFEWVLGGIAAAMLGSFLYIFLTSMHW
jgi:hypothetical protein